MATLAPVARPFLSRLRPERRAPAESRFEGFVDALDGAQLSGWAWNRADPVAAIDVDIYVDRAYACSVTADQLGGDLRAAGIGNGLHRWTCAIADVVGDDRVHEISARFGGTDIELGYSPDTQFRDILALIPDLQLQARPRGASHPRQGDRESRGARQAAEGSRGRRDGVRRPLDRGRAPRRVPRDERVRPCPRRHCRRRRDARQRPRRVGRLRDRQQLPRALRGPARHVEELLPRRPAGWGDLPRDPEPARQHRRRSPGDDDRAPHPRPRARSRGLASRALPRVGRATC